MGLSAHAVLWHELPVGQAGSWPHWLQLLIATYRQPRTGSHESVVQPLLSLHGGFAVKTQPVVLLQESVVQMLLSLHVMGVLTQFPFEHESAVQALLSSAMRARVSVCTQHAQSKQPLTAVFGSVHA